MDKRYLVLILIMAMVLPAMAVPTVPVVSLISGGNATFASTGGSGTCWFEWGLNQQSPEWITPNQTCSGAFTAKQYGSPYYPSQNYVVQACDDSGCSATTAFTSGTNPPIVVPTLGASWSNITSSNYNVINMITNIPTPLLWEFDPASATMGLALLTGIFIAFFWIGLWVRQRRVDLPVLLFMFLLAFFLTPQAGFNWGLPAEFASLMQLIVYAATTGIVVSFFKKG
jgi:hypothetical protein